MNYPKPINEPVLTYMENSIEKKLLKKELDRQIKNPVEIPIIINGEEIKSGDLQEIRAPHDHSLALGKYHKASKEHVSMAIEGALKAKEVWADMSNLDRAKIFTKAADILTGTYRPIVNAATMLGQSKTVHQSEIDAICELADFWRFNAYYLMTMHKRDELISDPGTFNFLQYRALEGFVVAIAPFNFTSITGNLASAPAIMGNVVLLKPSSNSVLSAYYIMKVLKETGLPDGVINFLPGRGRDIITPAINHKMFAGLHFTGSTETFTSLWKNISDNLSQMKYKNFPKIVGETGGKDFVLALPDSDISTLATALIRGAFEYQGQKCSAASRAYIANSIWPELKEKLINSIKEIRVGNTYDFSNFMGAVIDEKAFEKITNYIEDAKKSPHANIVTGGSYSNEKGFFIEPTIIETSDPNYKSMTNEIFGPVLTVHVYDDKKLDETLKFIDESTQYALTGAVFSKNRELINKVMKKLQYTAGNFYINDKPTGAVVGQQPFGGARMSGTDDKAGSYLNLLRWTSPRTIKENFTPPSDYRYPHMGNK